MLRLRLTVFLLALLVTAPGVHAQDTVIVNLSEAIARAMELSPDVRIEEAQARFAEGRLGLARSSRFLTQADATTAHAVAPGIDNPNGTATDRLYLDPDVRNDWESLRPYSRLDVDVIQPLWTWGQLSRSIDAARFGLEVEREAVASKQLEVAVRTGELYYTVLLLDAMDRLTGEAEDAVARARREVERMLEEGAEDVGDADLFQVLITEQEVRRRIVRVQEQSRTARTGLRRQLMLPEHAVVTVADRFLEPIPLVLDSLSTFQTLALAHRPELAQAKAGIEARRALVDVARSDFYPKLVWGVHAHYSGTTGRYRQRNPYVGDAFLSRSMETGLALRLQLNFAQTRSKVTQARANLEEVRHQETGARELILFEVEEAWRTVRIRQTELEAAEAALLLSREWLQTEYVNFDVGLGDTEDLIKAVQANLELQAGRHQAVFDLNVAILRLHAATGVLEPVMAY